MKRLVFTLAAVAALPLAGFAQGNVEMEILNTLRRMEGQAAAETNGTQKTQVIEPGGAVVSQGDATNGQKVQVVTSALPTGGATAANQTTANTSLATISTNTALPTLTRFRHTAVTNTAVEVKASTGKVHGWNIINPTATPVYIKFYDTAAGGVTVGTTGVAMTLAVPANGVFFLPAQPMPQQNFATAISLAAVTGVADNSTTAPASAVHVSVQYQ